MAGPSDTARPAGQPARRDGCKGSTSAGGDLSTPLCSTIVVRITVYDVLGWMAAGMNQQEILADYPELEPADLRACLSYAAEREHRLLRIAA